MTLAPEQRLAELDAQLLERAKPILVLKHLNWPDEVEEAFIDGWRAGRPGLPEAEICVPGWTSPQDRRARRLGKAL
jgi:hypothetical protein